MKQFTQDQKNRMAFEQREHERKRKELSQDLNKFVMSVERPGFYHDPMNTHQEQMLSSLQEQTRAEAGGNGVVFRNVKEHLIHYIDEADWVFGCVAWLTDEDILSRLAQKKGVLFFMQKEDFLRPDKRKNGEDWKRKLRELYGKLPVLKRQEFAGPISQMNWGLAHDYEDYAVRVVGPRNSEFSARMHHKFALFAKGDLVEQDAHLLRDEAIHSPDATSLLTCEGEWQKSIPDPYLVWTGSYNWSNSASRSLENAVILSDTVLISAFYAEFSRVAAISEDLDWGHEYVSPTWRIGS